MKSLLVKLGVVILIGLAIFGYAEVWGADWKLYGSSENYYGYYDAQSITRTSKNIVRVWLRSNLTETGVTDAAGKLGKEFENVNYFIILREINCAEKKSQRLSMTYYDNKGRVIHSEGSPGGWEFIVPESMFDLLYKEVCK